MSCHGCAGKFGVFYKEHACPNCGFSYCNKCLKYKAAVPKLGASVHKVCRTCHMHLTKGVDDSDSSKQKEYCPPSSFLSDPSPNTPGIFSNLPSVPSSINNPVLNMRQGNDMFSPKIYFSEEPVVRRLESLENPARPPITVYHQDQRIQQLKVGLKEADLEIVDRLEKLREERKQQPIPTEEEVARRLALLRGEDAVKMSTPNKIVPDTRTSQEKADNLLKQYVEEQQLDSKRPKPSDEIAQRLAKLRGHDTSSSSVKNVEEKVLNIEGDTTVAAESEGCSKSELEYNVSGLISQLQKEVKDTSEQMTGLAKVAVECLKSMEVKLHQKPNQENESSDEEVDKTIQKALDEVALEEELEEDSETSGKEEQLPWCIICNENATVRCIDCDNDLYCKSCFTQGHEEWEMQHHRTVPYTPKEKP